MIVPRDSPRRQPRVIIDSMSGDTLVLVIGVIVIAVIATLGIVFRAKRVKVTAAAHELRATEAARRGWTFVATGSAGHARGVYSGTTDLVPWRCESESAAMLTCWSNRTSSDTAARWISARFRWRNLCFCTSCLDLADATRTD